MSQFVILTMTPFDNKCQNFQMSTINVCGRARNVSEIYIFFLVFDAKK